MRYGRLCRWAIAIAGAFLLETTIKFTVKWNADSFSNMAAALLPLPDTKMANPFLLI